MKSFIIIIVLCAVTGLLSFSFSRTYARHRYYEDSLENDRLKYMNLVMASIKGKEKMRADSVFKNLKVIKGESSISAEHLLWMMNWGWSAELGVSCSHCHINGKWESDSLNTKDIARGMWNMRVQINQQILPGITGKNYWNKPAVTCLTCHRGKPVPDNKF